MWRGRFNSLRILFHTNYYDGPLAGLCQDEKTKYWFDNLSTQDFSGDLWIPYNDTEQDNDDNDVDFDVIRFYWIYSLTDEEIRHVEYLHSLFDKYVGFHTNYDENGQRHVGATHPKTQWSVYTKEREKYVAEHGDCVASLPKTRRIGWADSYTFHRKKLVE